MVARSARHHGANSGNAALCADCRNNLKLDQNTLLLMPAQCWLNFALWAARSAAQRAEIRSARGTNFRTGRVHVKFRTFASHAGFWKLCKKLILPGQNQLFASLFKQPLKFT
jgi:hypothetical protein